MGQSLSTTVNGSSGECAEAADALAKLFSGGHQAIDAIHAAKGMGDATWHGPAHDQFTEVITGLEPDFTTLTDRSMDLSVSLRNFADSLDAVEKMMADALSKAHGGGLMVDGPFIVSPDLPPPAPVLPTGPCGTAQAKTIMDKNQATIQANNAAVAEYNRKVAVYNECKAIVEQARTTEKNAHQGLRETVGTVDAGIANMSNLAPTVLARTLSYIGTMENTHRLETYKAERAETRAQFFDDYATGKAATATPGELVELAKAARKARFDAAVHTMRADQFDLWIRTEPEYVRKGVTAYPGKGALDNLPEHVSAGTKLGAKMLRSMPYLGSGLTIVLESKDALSGEQSWGKAVADSAANIGGGAVGSIGTVAAVSGAFALAGSTLGPLGTLVAGTIGGIAGAIGGQAVADWAVPK